MSSAAAQPLGGAILMLRSIRFRLTVAAILLVLLTAGSLMWFAHKDTIVTLRGSERRTLNNVLFLLERELASAHLEALKAKISGIQDIKADLREAARAASAVLAETSDLSPDESLKRLALWAAHPVDAASIVKVYRPDGHGILRDRASGEAAPSFAAALFPVLPRQGGVEYALNAETSGESLVLATRQGDTLITVSRPLADAERIGRARMEAAGESFNTLLRDVHIQETGFAAVVNEQGNIISGPPHAALPEKLRQTLAAGTFSSAARRVMVLPTSIGPNGEEAGEVLYLLGWFRPLRRYIVLAAPLDELEAPAFALVGRQLVITLTVTAGGLILGLLIASRIAGPVQRLTRVVRAFPEQDILTLDVASLEKQLPGRRRDEVGELARSFSHMAGELHANVVRLVESTARQERIENELQVARDIQYGILPAAFPHRSDVELHAAMVTAKAVGGDLYDFFFLDDKRLCFVIGDVSDKSVPASLFMSMTVTLLRVTMRHGDVSPEAAMSRISDTLARDNPRNMFVTLCICILDLATGDLSWCSAGHMPPVCVGKNGATALETSGDMVAGVFEGLPYKLLRWKMAPGEALFLYTDGVTEAMGKDKELFGEERLMNCLTKARAASVQDMAEAVFQAVTEFTAGEEQSDDIAVVAVRFLG